VPSITIWPFFYGLLPAGNSSPKVLFHLLCSQLCYEDNALGYKVGRVDQAETALGAEMRLAAAKSRGKVSEDKSKDKIVRRYVNTPPC
jgi:hypothetical protein